MPIPFSKYLIVKDKVCVTYFGECDETLVQLRGIRPCLEAAFPGLHIHFACKDSALHLLGVDRMAIAQTRFREERREFGAIYDITGHGSFQPVERFLDDCGVAPPRLGISGSTSGRRCVVCDTGVLPTKSMTAQQSQRVIAEVRSRGYRAEFGGDVAGADWVVGVEGVPLYEAAFAGVETTLVATGVGTTFFRKLFPGYRVLEI